MSRRSRGSRLARERGAAVVEFALVVPILLVLVFGVIQYGWYLYAMQSGTSAVGEAVRRLSVGDCQVQSERSTFLKNRLGSATTASTVSPTVTYTNPDGSSATSLQVGGTVRVELSYPSMDLNFPFLPFPDNGTVTRSYVGRVEDTTASVGGCS